MVGHVPEGQWTETHEILTEMLKVAECRGTDATGFAALAQPFGSRRAGRVVTDKEAVRAKHFVEYDSWRRLRRHRSVAVIGHTRMATRGDAALRVNAHPFAAGGYHLVHNGCLTNDADVADEFALRLRSQTDSEVLVRLVEAAGDPLAGLDLCLRRVTGTMAVALLDAHSHNVWLARHGRPLWLCRFEGQRLWWFGSTSEILLSAFEAVIGGRAKYRIAYLAPIPEMTALVLTPQGVLYAPSTRA
jgi:glucosamine 6-phosphate synthetase-like amidotransferase/phosphosugar isomerase protein